jgi:hypothetical protein
VNVVSYALICAWFLWTVAGGFFLRTRVVEASQIRGLDRVSIPYVDRQEMFRIVRLPDAREDAGGPNISLSAQNAWPATLQLERNADGRNVNIVCTYSFQAGMPTDTDGWRTVVQGFPTGALPNDYFEYRVRPNTSASVGKSAIDLRPVEKRAGAVACDSYRGYLLVRSPNSSYYLCTDLPFLGWRPRFVTVLPTGHVVFECGEQILLLDPSDGRLAYIASGTCPVVIPF